MGLSGNISFSGLMNGDIGETGGTTVVAIPTGTATDTLNKIQVDETIYSVDGGGSSITITPSLESGTKVADFTIDETSGILYAPTPTEYTAGTNVQISEQNVISATDTTYTAGNNITIENGVISAISGGVNRSTTEQVIGTWIDGKPLYEKTIIFTGSFSGNVTIGNLNISNLKKIVKVNIISHQNDGAIKGMCFAHPTSSNNFGIFINTSLDVNVRCGDSAGTFNEFIIIVEYTKTTD